MSNVSNKNQSPLEALGRLLGATSNESARVGGSLQSQQTEDIDSVTKGVETGGFLGGALQFLDVISPGNIASNIAGALVPGGLSPQMKETISAAVNAGTGNPMFLKDLADMATAPAQPGVPPSAPNSVPGPDVEQLRGEPPHAPGGSERTGYTDSPAPPRAHRDIQVCTEEATMPMKDMLAAMDFLKNSPECAARFPDIHSALNNDYYSVAEQSAVIVCSLLRDHPEMLDGVPGAEEARAAIPRSEIPSTPAVPTTPTETTAPAAPPIGSTGQGDFSQAGPQLQDMLGGALGFIGGLLSNPMVQGLLIPALSALCLAVPPLQVLIPFLPMIIPMAGQLLSGAGSALSGGAGAGGGAAPGGLGGDALGGMLNGLLGAFGAPAGLPAGSAPVFA